jgi:predicted MFS family arabinose efflux permease
MTNRALLALGLGQCVNWGVLYYAFSAWLLPIEQDVHAPRWVITGAFSVALLLSAAAAPLVGRLGDRGHGPALIQFGGLAAAALLAAWAALPGVVALYVLWAGLGVCMAATLYEPAFVVVGRAVADPAERLRALALVTLVGGLASTVFLPLTGFLVSVAGWRGSVAILAVVLGASTAATRLLTFRGLSADDAGPSRAPLTIGVRPLRPPLWLLVTFGFGSLASTAVIANLVPALVAGSLSPPVAAALGGLFGVMQLPGRALLFHGRLQATPRHLLVISLALQAAGLVCWAATTGAVGPTVGLAVFAVGGGLSTLVRPVIVQSLFGSQAGLANGRLAQVQHLARAIGPFVGGWVAGGAGYAALLAGFGVAFLFLAVATALSEAKRERFG